MNRTFAMSAAALFLSLGIVPCIARAEEDAPPPPPERSGRPEGFQRRGAGRDGFMAGLTDEERTKMAELVKNVGDALTAYKATPTDETKAVLKTQVAATFEFRQKLAIDRAEKMLAKAKERLKNKDEEVNKQVERLLKPRKERPERPERPEGPPRAGMRRPFGGEWFGAPMRAAMAGGVRGPRGPMGPNRQGCPNDPLVQLLMAEPAAPIL